MRTFRNLHETIFGWLVGRWTSDFLKKCLNVVSNSAPLIGRPSLFLGVVWSLLSIAANRANQCEDHEDHEQNDLNVHYSRDLNRNGVVHTAQ